MTKSKDDSKMPGQLGYPNLTKEEIHEALETLHELGLIRDTGRREPGPDGEMQIVWDVVDRIPKA